MRGVRGLSGGASAASALSRTAPAASPAFSPAASPLPGPATAGPATALAAALVLLLLLPALAGCLAGPGDRAAGPADPSGFGLDVVPLDPASREAGPDDWFVAATPSGPEGRVAAFAWRVPQGAVALEAVPLLPDGVDPADPDDPRAPTQWGVLKFRVALGQAILSGGYLSAAVESTTRSRTGPAEERTVAPPTGPVRMELAAQPGEVVAVVLAARSEEPSRFGLAFRALDHHQEHEPRVADRDAFMEAVGDRPGRLLTPIGETAGFDVPAYLEVNDLDGGHVARTPSVEVHEGLPAPPQRLEPRPLATVRDVTLVSDFAVEAGWGLALGGYLHGVGTGRWSLEARMHDHDVEARGVLTPASGVDGGTVFGVPLFLLTGEGPGESHVEFRVATASVNPRESLALLQVEIGGTLTGLFGFEGLALSDAQGGLADVEPTVDAGAGPADGWVLGVEDGDLVAEGPDGARLVVAGMGAGPAAASTGV